MAKDYDYELTEADLLDELGLPVSETRPGSVEEWLESGQILGVQSSWCSWIRWDEGRRKLIVQFHRDGVPKFRAGYQVSKEVARAMWQAASKGKFVHAYLKGIPYTDEGSAT